MKLAADFRKIARESLRGRWKIAVLVGLVATLLGGLDGKGPGIEFKMDAPGSSINFTYAGKTILSTAEGVNPQLKAFITGGFIYILILSLVLTVAYFVLSGIISVGYSKFNLNLVDRMEASFNNLFEQSSHWKQFALARFLKSLYIFAGYLMLVVPGIIATYSYAMTDFILADNPELTATEALKKSKEMMIGNRWRLFCLQFSFIGWGILASLTFGIGNLFLNPYMSAARADFYREVSDTDPSKTLSQPEEDYPIDFDAILAKRKEREGNYYHNN